MQKAHLPLLKQLSTNSEPYCDPLSHLDWGALSLDEPWLPDSALSLVGVAEFEAQPPLVKLRLSQYEFIHFIEAGLWLERIFIERFGAMLKHASSHAEYTYHLHEIREEAGHSLMFLKLMANSGLHLPVSKPPRFADYLGRFLPIDSTLFWLALTVGEDVPDKINRHIRAQGAAINSLIQQMCTLHIRDEARHIARARDALQARLENMSPLARLTLRPLARILVKQFAHSFYLPPATVYELAGLTPGKHWRQAARRNPQRSAFIQQSVAPILNMLARYGIPLLPPKL